jgi:hypothetical protein
VLTWLAEVAQAEATASVLVLELLPLLVRELWASPCAGEKSIGRVTDMSVPTPVSGSRIFACARSSPVESALTVTTRPTPRPSPSAVRMVRPLRRRSSESMYVRKNMARSKARPRERGMKRG